MINRYLSVLTVTCIISINGISIFEAGPPKPTNHALVAREVLHSSAWVSLSTISTMPDIKSFPYAGLESIVDGTDEKGNGVPYFFVTALDQAILDIQADSRCSVMASMAQQDWCVKYNIDQEDPRCQRVVLTGNFVWLDKTTEEYTKANENMLRRHPQFSYWPNVHDFSLAKMDIKQVTLFDWFGGIKTVNLKDYFNAHDSNEI